VAAQIFNNDVRLNMDPFGSKRPLGLARPLCGRWLLIAGQLRSHFLVLSEEVGAELGKARALRPVKGAA
jgi:hypothetical protein